MKAKKFNKKFYGGRAAYSHWKGANYGLRSHNKRAMQNL